MQEIIMAIMAIDWGRKRMGLAYMNDIHGIIFPLWSLDNNADVLYSIAHFVMQHKATKILVGYPSQQAWVQKSIDNFIKQLSFVISPDCPIVKVNEDYSSIQANAMIWVYKKTAEEDSLAAVCLLEEWKKNSVV